jgi:hypothetical protein
MANSKLWASFSEISGDLRSYDGVATPRKSSNAATDYHDISRDGFMLGLVGLHDLQDFQALILDISMRPYISTHLNKVVTRGQMADYVLLFFLHHGSRERAYCTD